MIRFAKNGLAFDGERVDLMLYNSHDCGCAFKLIASVWRQICGNGLMVASEFANFSHKHIGFNPDDFIHSAGEIASSAGTIADQVDDMKVIEMTPDERNIFAMSAHNLLYDDLESAPVHPDQLLSERRYDDKGNDLWTTFNVIQENIMRGGLKGENPRQQWTSQTYNNTPGKSLGSKCKTQPGSLVFDRENG